MFQVLPSAAAVLYSELSFKRRTNVSFEAEVVALLSSWALPTESDEPAPSRLHFSCSPPSSLQVMSACAVKKSHILASFVAPIKDILCAFCIDSAQFIQLVCLSTAFCEEALACLHFTYICNSCDIFLCCAKL